MAGKVISIEIGYSLTRVCEVDYKSKSHKVYEHFTIPTPEGVINDGILNLSTEYISSLKDAIAQHKLKTKQVVFTLTSTKIASREVVIPFVKENRIMDVVNANASDYFPVDLSQYQLAYTILGVLGEPKTGQQYKLLVLAAPLSLLSGYQELAKALRLELAALDYAGNSIYQVVKSECADKAQMIVKIEEGATMVMVVNHSVLSFIRSVSYGIEEALQLTYRLPLKNKIENAEQAMELLSKKAFVNGAEENAAPPSEAGEGETPRSKEEEFCDSMTDVLQPLVGAVARVVDYYVSHNANVPIEKILLTGLGANMKGIHKLLAQQLEYPIEILHQAEGFQLEKSFEKKLFGEYVACVGAAAAPLGFKQESEKGKGAAKKGADAGGKESGNGLVIALAVLVIGVVAAVVLSVMSAVKYIGVKSENEQKLAEVEALQEIIPIYNEYVTTKEAYDRLTAMYDATKNRNDDLYAFMEELERKMPSNALISSFTSDEVTVTMTMTVASKSEAAAMIEQLRTFDSLVPDTVSVSAITAEAGEDDVVLSYNFTITGEYRSMDEEPEEETDAQTQDASEEITDGADEEFAMNR